MSIATAALLISILNLVLLLYKSSKDRAKLKPRCHLVYHRETDEPVAMVLQVTNTGTRPILLTAIEGHYHKGAICSESIGSSGKGIKLEENDLFEHRIGQYDPAVVCDPKGDGMFENLVDLRILDSTGKSHSIAGARRNIEKLKASQHPTGYV